MFVYLFVMMYMSRLVFGDEEVLPAFAEKES